jgi:hypothetical protein
MTRIETLFNEKIRMLETMNNCVQKYRDLLSPKSDSAQNATPEEKLDWVDTLTSERESNLRMLQLIDQQIEMEKMLMEPVTLEKLQGTDSFKVQVEQILHLGNEIQLTDQSLFLYINNIGFEIRAQILRGLKEKEALSKFKSQNQSPTGEGLDQKA